MLLSPTDTRIWLDHLYTVQLNRKRGAAKASLTRRTHAKKSLEQTKTFCGTCNKLFVEETEEVEVWVYCDTCEKWFCDLCEDSSSASTLDTFLCKNCSCV